MGNRLYIGLTGRMGSGKGEAARVLEQEGYRYISLSDIVREEIARTGKRVTRSEMQDFGNSLRKMGGAGVLGRRVCEKIEASDQDRWVIDGIRNPAEVAELRKLDNFFLLGVNAQPAVILQRIRSRKRSTDHADDVELKKRLDREWGVGEPEDGQQVGRCMDMADFTIENNNRLEDLKQEIAKILQILNTIGEKNVR